MRSVAEHRPSDFLATNRGGGLYSEAISQRLGALVAYVSARRGLPPTAITLANLVVALAASVTLVACASRMAAGTLPAAALGLFALLAWQIGYAFDCADGQLARVTGQASPAGARLDILADVAAQTGLVTAVAAVAVAYRPGTPTWLVAAFAGTWMVNLVTSLLQSSDKAASMVASRSIPVRVVKLIRDYGAVVLVAGLFVTFAPQWTVVFLIAFTAANGLFLLASVAFAARSALRVSRPG